MTMDKLHVPGALNAANHALESLPLTFAPRQEI
jgi:hypothetical protein